MIASAIIATLVVVVGMPGVAHAAAHSATFGVNTNDLTLGSILRFSGSVATAPAGKGVALEVLYGTTWRQVASTRTNSVRAYAVLYRPASFGNYRFRLRVPASDGRSAFATAPKTVTVFRWTYLTNVRPLDLGIFDNWRGAPHEINGRVYPNSLDGVARSNGEDIWEYNLGRTCTTLKITIGVLDTALTGSFVAFSIRTDGVERYVQQLRLGQSATLQLPLNGYLRLTLGARGLTNYGSEYGYGDPQIRCKR